jgi:hypothetical protein
MLYTSFHMPHVFQWYFPISQTFPKEAISNNHLVPSNVLYMRCGGHGPFNIMSQNYRYEVLRAIFCRQLYE